MLRKNNHNISEKELDNLLNQAFLNLNFNDPKNQELMELTAQHLLSDENILPNKTKNQLNIKSIILIIASIITIAFALFFINKQNTQSPIEKSNKVQAQTKTSDSVLTTLPQTIIASKDISITQKNKNGYSKINNTSNSDVLPETLSLITSTDQMHNKDNNEQVAHYKQENSDTAYIFPKLNEKEIKATKKQKKKMANWLLNQMNKRSYLNNATFWDIPNKFYANTTKIKDTLANFYMQNTEVSNLEYRTFLFDLLINGEKETFLKAKPKQELWKKVPAAANGSWLTEVYFSDERFNAYPVVNITPEGAELYCIWLSNLTNNKILARLPYEIEWIRAAKGENSQAVYPWTGELFSDKNNCYLANFCIQNQQADKGTSNSKECKIKNMNGYSVAEYSGGESIVLSKVLSFEHNDYGMSCMSGNVAEMVYLNNTKKVVTKGGSWNSKPEDCKLFKQEELNNIDKANAMTGFRPVILDFK